jgi:predicted RNA-binding Zn-ribbon protein involved in translation (DUF1610 family)
MSKHDNIYSILGKLASLEPQPPKQQNILKQLNESAVVAANPLSLKDRLAQKLAEAKTVDEDMLAKKDFDGDGKRESGKAEYMGSKDKAIKNAMGKKDIVDEAKEKTMSRAAKGHEKYGKEGMQALAKAGREGKDLDKVRAKYDKYDDDKSVNEGEYQDGPNKSDVPAFQRKAKAAPGDDSWKTSQQDLDDEASKSPTGAAGLAKAKARLGMNEEDPMEESSDYEKQIPQGMSDKYVKFKCPSCGTATNSSLMRADNYVCPSCKKPLPVKNQMPLGEEELYDENNAHSSLPGTRRVSDKEHSEYDAAAHTVRKWMRKRGWNPKSEFKPAMKYIIDNLDATHDDTLTDDVKMAACTCRKHHDGIEKSVDEGFPTVDDARKAQGTGKFDVQKTSTGTRYTRKPETFDSGDDDGEEKSASDGPKKKGRPAKAKAPERTTSNAWKHKGARVTEAINLETYVEDTMAEIAALFIVEKAKGKKPDFLDMDKDGDKKEPMSKAVGDKKKNPFGNKKEVTEAKQQLVENSLQAIVRRFGKEVREFAEGGDFDQDLFEALYDYYFDDMPYGVKKARDGDPYEWVADHFHDAIQSGDVEINETKVGHKDLDELAALAGIGGRQQMESSCNMTAEGQMCPEHGMVECGGMMYEGEEKPDFLDVDKDDDTEESFKKAVDDKEGNSDDKEDLEECGMPPMGGMTGSEPESGMSINTSMDTKTGRKTVTVTADGEAAEELAQMLKMAGMAGSRPEPEHKHIGVVIGGAGSSQEVDEEYANEPDVKMASTRAIMQQGNDLNRPKTQYKHSYRGGDNPMSMKEDKLFKLYDAMKSK